MNIKTEARTPTVYIVIPLFLPLPPVYYNIARYYCSYRENILTVIIIGHRTLHLNATLLKKRKIFSHTRAKKKKRRCVKSYMYIL